MQQHSLLAPDLASALDDGGNDSSWLLTAWQTEGKEHKSDPCSKALPGILGNCAEMQNEENIEKAPDDTL